VEERAEVDGRGFTSRDGGARVVLVPLAFLGARNWGGEGGESEDEGCESEGLEGGELHVGWVVDEIKCFRDQIARSER